MLKQDIFGKCLFFSSNVNNIVPMSLNYFLLKYIIYQIESFF